MSGEKKSNITVIDDHENNFVESPVTCEIPVRPVEINWLCDAPECKGFYIFAGICVTVKGMRNHHTCNKCGKHNHANMEYPYIATKRLD